MRDGVLHRIWEDIPGGGVGRQPEPEDRQPEPEPVIELVPDVSGPRRSSRVRRPTMRYGDPVEIPETIQDEGLFG